MNSEHEMKLNLGCGTQVVDGWINVDYAFGARLVKNPILRFISRQMRLFKSDWNNNITIYNLTKRFPWPDQSAEVIYSSHFLEHLLKEDGSNFLKECHRCLCTGGIIRVLVPDLRNIVNKYIDNRIVADDFVRELGVLYSDKSQGWKRYLSPFIQFPHKCMYDMPRLLQILDDIGFDCVPCSAFESKIDGIRAIELEDRSRNSVIVEGIKR